MISDYIKIMYPEDSKNEYPAQLCEYLSDHYLENFKNKKVKFLDLGCGRGTQIKEFMQIFEGNFHGIDLSRSEIKNVTVKSCNLEEESLDYESNFFDIVFSKSVIEHVSNTENFIREVYRVLKPGGVFIVMAPDWQTQMKNFYDDFTHVKPFTIRSLSAVLKTYGFEKVDVNLFTQLPLVWKYPLLQYLCDIIRCTFPEKLKWKSKTGRNTKDRKWIRFSKEKMLIGVCTK
tara:strand:+ start:1464 stop:2156 length:693 start_codon:yes stop_codon:yes gene_type:complete